MKFRNHFYPIHIVASSHCLTPGEGEEGHSAAKCNGRRIDECWKTLFSMQYNVIFHQMWFKGGKKREKELATLQFGCTPHHLKSSTEA